MTSTAWVKTGTYLGTAVEYVGQVPRDCPVDGLQPQEHPRPIPVKGAPEGSPSGERPLNFFIFSSYTSVRGWTNSGGVPERSTLVFLPRGIAEINEHGSGAKFQPRKDETNVENI